MKNKMPGIFAMLACALILFSACGFNSGIAVMRIQSSTRTSWKQSHDFLSGTEKQTLFLGNEPQEMEIKVVTDDGKIDITVTGKGGEEIIVLEDAKTGTYEFSAEGKIKITVKAKEHRGSFEIKRINS